MLLSESYGCLKEYKQKDSQCYEFISCFLIIGWVYNLEGEGRAVWRRKASKGRIGPVFGSPCPLISTISPGRKKT